MEKISSNNIKQESGGRENMRQEISGRENIYTLRKLLRLIMSETPPTCSGPINKS